MKQDEKDNLRRKGRNIKGGSMVIEERIREAENLLDIQDVGSLKNEYNTWCANIRRLLQANAFSEEKLNEIRVKIHYTENEYSNEDTRKSILKALQDTIRFLQDMENVEPHEVPKDIAIMLVHRILIHFQTFYQLLFECPLHKKCTWKKETLQEIQIRNEYDLQRMVYASLLPTFPTGRQEVDSDNGYSGMRADIYLDEYDIIVELKCTHAGMTEKRLTEEIGADAFHYKADTIFFFVYDKYGIIKNKEAFTNSFARNRQRDGKLIKAIIFQKL